MKPLIAVSTVEESLTPLSLHAFRSMYRRSMYVCSAGRMEERCVRRILQIIWEACRHGRSMKEAELTDPLLVTCIDEAKVR